MKDMEATHSPKTAKNIQSLEHYLALAAERKLHGRYDRNTIAGGFIAGRLLAMEFGLERPETDEDLRTVLNTIQGA